MAIYFAADALLPDGWARDVRITVNGSGDISEIAVNALQSGAETLNGATLPGMANLHSHAFQRAMAGLAEFRNAPDDDFWTWRELMYRFVSRLSPGHAQAIARHLYIEMLKSGYTAVAEFHYVHRATDGAPYDEPAEMLMRHLAAARETGIAITLLPSLYAWSDFGQQPLQPRQRRFATDPAAILEMARAARAESGADPDVRVGVAPHSLRAADAGQLDELVAGIRQLDSRAPIHIHAAEQTREVDACIAWSGKRPVEWLLGRMPVDRYWCLVHSTHLTEEETTALAHSGAVAGLCPTTEGNLGDGIFPMLGYRAAGGRYGIGGDSHVSRSPAEELRMLEYVQRLAVRRRNLVVGERSRAVGTTLWLEAASGGAQALGRQMGAIAPGHRADLVVLDGEHPDLASRSGDAHVNALIFSGSAGLVRDVMVGGRWVLQKRRHVQQERAAEEFQRAVKELLA
jgi:formimidoylglutamate deiminase